MTRKLPYRNFRQEIRVISKTVYGELLKWRDGWGEKGRLGALSSEGLKIASWAPKLTRKNLNCSVIVYDYEYSLCLTYNVFS